MHSRVSQAAFVLSAGCCGAQFRMLFWALERGGRVFTGCQSLPLRYYSLVPGLRDSDIGATSDAFFLIVVGWRMGRARDLRALKDQSQRGSTLLPVAGDLRAICVQRAVIRTYIRSAFEVQVVR